MSYSASDFLQPKAKPEMVLNSISPEILFV